MRKTLIFFIFLLNVTILNGQIKVAVLDFENTSTIEKYDGFGKAMSNMLLTDLKNNIHPRKISFLERSQLNKILNEQQLQNTKNFDKNTAVTFGKLAGVKYVILGGVYVLDGICNLNSRMVDVESSEIIYAKESNGKITDWLNLKTKLAEELSAELNNPIQIEEEYTNIEVNEGTISQYSKVIELLESGELEEASKLLSVLTSIQPDFKYLDELKFDIEQLKEQVAKNTADIAENTANISQNTSDISENKEDISTLNKSGGLVIEVKTINEYLNNLNSDLLDFKEKRKLFRELFLKFEYDEILKLKDRTFFYNSDINYFSLEEILNQDILFLDNLKSSSKKELYNEMIINELFLLAIKDQNIIIRVYKEIETLLSILYDLKNIKVVPKSEYLNYCTLNFFNFSDSANKDFFRKYFEKMIISYEEILEKNIPNYNSENLKFFSQNILENEDLKENSWLDFENLIRIAIKQKISNFNSLEIDFFKHYNPYWDKDELESITIKIDAFNQNYKNNFLLNYFKSNILRRPILYPNLYKLGINVSEDKMQDYLYAFESKDELHEETIKKVFFYSSDVVKFDNEFEKTLTNNNYYKLFLRQVGNVNLAFNFKKSCENDSLVINNNLDYFTKVISLYEEGGRPLCNGFEKILSKHSFLNHNPTFFLKDNKANIFWNAKRELGYSVSKKDLSEIDFIISNDFDNGSHVHLVDFYDKDKTKEFTVINIDQEVMGNKKFIINSKFNFEFKHIEIQYYDFLEKETDLLLRARYSNFSVDSGPLVGVEKYINDKYELINSINDKLKELNIPDEIINNIFSIYSEDSNYFFKYFYPWLDKWGPYTITFENNFEYFNKAFEFYSNKESNLSSITWGIMINYFLNSYYSNKELNDKFLEKKIILDDYLIANKLNTITGLIVFSTKSESKNTTNFLKKFMELDLDYKFKTGDWKKLKVRDMIISDTKDLYNKNIIDLDLKNKILSLLD